MASLDSAPASVRGWFAARDSDEPTRGLREVLTEDAVLEFAGRQASGADAVIERLLAMPSGGLAGVEWSVLPPAREDEVTVRGTGVGGAPLPSPGGPMAAMDFTFGIGADGRITAISPHPHHTEPGDLAPALTPGQVAPDFTLPDVDGVAVALHDGAAATVVVFTCNPCPWALAWHPRLQQVARDYDAHGVRFLQIDANDPTVSTKDAVEVSRRRVADGEFAGPYLVDEGQKVARRWGARHTPDVFVLDAAGVVTYHGAPDPDMDDDAQDAVWVRGALDAALAGRLADPAVTQPTGCTIKWTL